MGMLKLRMSRHSLFPNQRTDCLNYAFEGRLSLQKNKNILLICFSVFWNTWDFTHKLRHFNRCFYVLYIHYIPSTSASSCVFYGLIMFSSPPPPSLSHRLFFNTLQSLELKRRVPSTQFVSLKFYSIEIQTTDLQKFRSTFLDLKILTMLHSV